MGIIYPEIPSPGSPNSTEDQKITNGMGTIRDEINGLLDNTNIKPTANIVGSKLADLSVSTAKIGDDQITSDKLGTNSVTSDAILAGAVGSAELAIASVVSGKIPFFFDSNLGGVTAATGVISSVPTVPPGTYFVLGQCATNGAWHSFSIGSSGGATITQPTSPFSNTSRLTGGTGSLYVSGFQAARVVVTATTTLTLSATYVSGGMIGSLYVFGVTAA